MNVSREAILSLSYTFCNYYSRDFGRGNALAQIDFPVVITFLDCFHVKCRSSANLFAKCKRM